MNKNSVIIGFCGDIMIGRLVNEQLAVVSFSHLWGDLLPHLRGVDLLIGNLEAALTYSQDEVAKVFNFKSDPHHVQVLKEAGFNLVNLANNHILDYGEAGLLETLTTLDTVAIAHVGAGCNLGDARRPVIIERQGIRIGVLGFTDNEPGWLAGEERPGIAWIEIGDISAVEKEIKELRNNVDLLVVTLHWGPNMIERPTGQFVQFAHDLIDLGVDIIHGHSAHIFQGVEFYKNSIIIYDSGDFVDDYMVDTFLRNDRSFFFEIEVDANGPRKVTLTPTLIQEMQVNAADGSDRDEAIQRMQSLSKEMGTHLEIVKNADGRITLIGRI